MNWLRWFIYVCMYFMSYIFWPSILGNWIIYKYVYLGEYLYLKKYFFITNFIYKLNMENDIKIVLLEYLGTTRMNEGD